MLLSLFFFPKISWVIWGPLRSYMNFRILFPISAKNNIEILIRIPLTLQIVLGSMNISNNMMSYNPWTYGAFPFIHTLFNFLLFFLFFYFSFYGCKCSIQKFPGQESNLSHKSDNARSLTCCAIRDFHRTFFLWTISLGEMPMLFLSHSTVALLCSSMGLCNPQHQSSCWVDILGREYLVPISAFSIHL